MFTVLLLLVLSADALCFLVMDVLHRAGLLQGQSAVRLLDRAKSVEEGVGLDLPRICGHDLLTVVSQRQVVAALGFDDPDAIALTAS